MSETALTVQSPHLMPAMSMMEARSRFQSLVAFTSDIMREGVDYGTIPGTNKPTLLKPGAEKLTTFFGLSTRFDIIEKVEDWIGDQHGGEPFFYYWFRCEMRRGDLLIAEADGSCNSWESKYRYRTAERKCPNCGQTTIIKGKEQYGGGWLCWAKRGGCGAKFKNGDQAIELANQEQPDVILMDIIMPGMSGFQTTRKLSRDPATRAIPVIFVSTKDGEADRVWGMRQGAIGFVTKPVNPEALFTAITDAVAA